MQQAGDRPMLKSSFYVLRQALDQHGTVSQNLQKDKRRASLSLNHTLHKCLERVIRMQEEAKFMRTSLVCLSRDFNKLALRLRPLHRETRIVVNKIQDLQQEHEADEYIEDIIETLDRFGDNSVKEIYVTGKPRVVTLEERREAAKLTPADVTRLHDENNLNTSFQNSAVIVSLGWWPARHTSRHKDWLFLETVNVCSCVTHVV